MIRRSTLVFLTCLAALGPSALRAEPAVSAPQILIAQASGGTQSRELELNSKGEAVKALQTRLQESDYYKGPIDGIYGLATQKAVSSFQADAGLSQTGTVDDETYQQLRVASGTTAATSPAEAPGSPSAPDAPNASADATPPNGPPDAGDGSAVLAVDDAEEGGLGKVFGIGLGLSAVLASFGVGFFIANRDKRDSSTEGEWGEIEPSTRSSSTSVTPESPQKSFQTSESQPGSYEGNATSNGNASAIAPVVPSVPTSGQMGGTSPLGKVDVIDGLIGDLRNPDPSQRRKAIWELGQRGNSIAMQPLVDSMVDADSKEKSLVLAALSEIGIRSLKPMSRALAIALQDDNPEVRKNAIRDLTRVYDLVVQISQMLGHATEDEDPEVRQTATWALAQLNRIRQSHDDDPNIRTFAGGSNTPSGPIDLLSSEASLRRSQQGL